MEQQLTETQKRVIDLVIREGQSHSTAARVIGGERGEMVSPECIRLAISVIADNLRDSQTGNF